MRFRKRPTEDHVDRLLRESRPAPSEELVSTIVSRLAGARSAVRRGTPLRRVAVAMLVTALAVTVAALMGGISSATAGAGSLMHVATKSVSTHHTTGSVNTTTGQNNTKGDEGKNGKDDDGDDDGDNEGADHHQYKVTICHWADHKYVTISVSPQGAAQHKAHHPLDIVPAPPGGCPGAKK